MIKKFIAWGHSPLGIHSHSYIHATFKKAFEHLGWDTYWFNNSDDVSHFDFSNSLFLTEGQVDAEIPVRNDCAYILHNCNCPHNYPGIKKVLTLQVYTKDVKNRALNNPHYQKIGPCCYVQTESSGVTLYQSWGTDLLPDEIDLEKAKIVREPVSNFIGSLGRGKFGNWNEWDTWSKACNNYGIKFNQYGNKSFEEQRNLIEVSSLAPALTGQWQTENHYIPCRSQKNISYGQLGLTNNEGVKELLGDHVIYNKDPYLLFFDGMKEKDNIEMIQSAMREVQKNHTYLSRISNILSVLGLEV